MTDAEIEHDEHDPTREYIPVGKWEVQTKGRGSSYRLLNKETNERHNILGADAAFVQAFFTQFAKDTFAEMKSLLSRAQTAERQRDEAIEALKAIVADIDDYERANNLSPNPPRVDCWDSVARARALTGGTNQQ